MDRKEFLSVLARHIFDQRLSESPLKVAIDGPCGAGKTMLADELAAQLSLRGFQILRPSIDGFHHPQEHRYRQGEFSARGYYEDAFDYAAVIENLLKPLSGNTFPALCRQVSLDLRTNLPADGPPVSVSTRTILLFDGVFLLRQELNSYWDFRILVDADPATAVSRAVARDNGSTGSAEIIRRKYEARYEPAWQMYLESERPQLKADIVIDNSDVAHPKILRGIGARDERL